MTRHPNHPHGFQRISAMIDIEEELETLEDEIALAARLMVTFIDPGSGDEDELEMIARALSTAMSEARRDIGTVHGLLKRALTECLDSGWLPVTRDRPCHLTRLMEQAVSDGDRLGELAESYHAAQAALADLPSRERPTPRR